MTGGQKIESLFWQTDFLHTMSNDLYYAAEKERASKPSLEEEVAELKVLVTKQTEQICSLLEEMVAPIRIERRRNLREAVRDLYFTGYCSETKKRMDESRKKWTLELKALDDLIAASKHSYFS